MVELFREPFLWLVDTMFLLSAPLVMFGTASQIWRHYKKEECGWSISFIIPIFFHVTMRSLHAGVHGNMTICWWML